MSKCEKNQHGKYQCEQRSLDFVRYYYCFAKANREKLMKIIHSLDGNLTYQNGRERKAQKTHIES